MLDLLGVLREGGESVLNNFNLNLLQLVITHIPSIEKPRGSCIVHNNLRGNPKWEKTTKCFSYIIQILHSSTSTNWMGAPTPGFTTINLKEAPTPGIYKHQLEGSSNSLFLSLSSYPENINEQILSQSTAITYLHRHDSPSHHLCFAFTLPLLHPSYLALLCFYAATNSEGSPRAETLRVETPSAETARAETSRAETLRSETLRDETSSSVNLRVETLSVETLRSKTLRIETPTSDRWLVLNPLI